MIVNNLNMKKEPNKTDEVIKASYEYIRENFIISPEELIAQKKITIDPEMMGGTACFYPIRLPVSTLVDYMNNGYSLKQFEDDFEVMSEEEAKWFVSILR